MIHWNSKRIAFLAVGCLLLIGLATLLVYRSVTRDTGIPAIQISTERTDDSFANPDDIAKPRNISPSNGSTHNIVVFNTYFQGGRISPSVFYAKVGDTMHIDFESREGATSLSIPSLNLSQNVTPDHKAILEFSQQSAGEFPIVCESCETEKMVWKIIFQ